MTIFKNLQANVLKILKACKINAWLYFKLKFHKKNSFFFLKIINLTVQPQKIWQICYVCITEPVIIKYIPDPFNNIYIRDAYHRFNDLKRKLNHYFTHLLQHQSILSYFCTRKMPKWWRFRQFVGKSQYTVVSRSLIVSKMNSWSCS